MMKLVWIVCLIAGLSQAQQRVDFDDGALLWGDNSFNYQQRTNYQCWHQGRWVSEGAQIDRGRYWYECRGGQHEPRGCFDDFGRRIQIGESYESSSGYVHTCQLDTAGYLVLPLTACVFEGRRHIPGDSFDDLDRKYWYLCSRVDQQTIAMQVAGCISNGRRLNIGETVETADAYYECLQKENKSVALCCGGCIQDGRRYRAGEQYRVGAATYECQRCQKVCIYGCDQNRGFGFKEAVAVNGVNRDVIVRDVKCTYAEFGQPRVTLPRDSYTILYSDQQQTSIGLACQRNYYGAYQLVKFRPEEMVYKTQGLTFYAPEVAVPHN